MPTLHPKLNRSTPWCRAALAAALVATCLLPGARAWSSDQPVRGSQLRAAADPSSGPSSRRRLLAAARESASATSVSGDPILPYNSSAAILQIQISGATPSTQTFTLKQGFSSAGLPYWQGIRPAGFKYADRKGEQGPVRTLTVRRSSAGTFQIKAVLRGTAGNLALLPPNPGTEAFLLLTLGTGDRYCVRFGAGAPAQHNNARAFVVEGAATPSCPATVSGDLLALSYNVAGLPEGISGSNPSVNTPLIAPLLNGYDLVLMQETWKTPESNPLAPLRVYHEILEAGADHPFKSISAPQPLGANPARPEAILADGLNQFSRFPFGSTTRVAWTGCDNSAADCLATKGFSMARTTFAPGVTVDVYDLHMEAGGTPNDDLLRDAGVTQLSSFIQANSAGRPIIVGGDFNLHTDSEPDSSQFNRLLAETGLQDVCAALSCPQPGRIDKFLFRSAGAVTLTPISWHFETDVFKRTDGQPLSDHDALAVRFAWSVAAE